jgi:hypothetical protein
VTRCLRLSGDSGAPWRDGDPFAAPARHTHPIGRASERSRRCSRMKWRPGGHRARHGRRGNVILIGSARAVHIIHTCALQGATPFGRAPPPSRKQVLRRARVTSHPMMQMCGYERPGLAEPAAWHGVGPTRRGTYAIEYYSESTQERADAWHGTVDCTLDSPEGSADPGCLPAELKPGIALGVEGTKVSTRRGNGNSRGPARGSLFARPKGPHELIGPSTWEGDVQGDVGPTHRMSRPDQHCCWG